MTGMYEQTRPGIGHNQPDEYAEEKKHAEVGALGQEAHLRARARRHLQPPLQGAARGEARLPVERGALEGRSRPVRQERHQPAGDLSIIQSLESHIEAYAPGAFGQKHGHLNSAVFYVLKGHGHDVHDGRHIKWEAGDVMIVENGCVHQHFNDDPENETILLVFKAKPLFLFMHLLFQKIVEWPPDKLPPGQEDYKPPADI